MKHQTVRSLDARPVTKEVISAGDFVRLSEDQKQKIKSVEIVPPRLGSRGFGGIKVDYKTPVYKVF